MHPLFKNRGGLSAYLFAWVPLGAMLGFVTAAAGDLSWRETAALVAPVTVLLSFVCLSPWYLCRALPLNTAPRWKLATHHCLAAMCASTLVLMIAPLAAHFLVPGSRAELEALYKPAVPVLAVMCFLFYLLSIALHYVLQTLEISRQAEVLSREAELKALKAQVNPHFLFNSLNSISALTSVDPARAREMCIKLADFLRSSLRLGERTSIPFGEELTLAGTYLDVEQVRFGRRLRVARDFDPACELCEVPPLLVQPLVENAIKHGIANLTDGGEVALTAHVIDGRLRFQVENPFDPDAPAQQKSGFGLVNVRNRLKARYGPVGRLDIEIDKGVYRVVLSVPFSKEKEGARA